MTADPDLREGLRAVVMQSLEVGAPGLSDSTRQAITRSIILKAEGRVFAATLAKAESADTTIARLSAEAERRAALISIAEQDRLGAEDIYAGGGDDDSVIAHLECRIESRRLIARTALQAADKPGERIDG